ncbi:type VI secretion system protein TssA [Sphingomonas sp. H39-1-10]|uniref:type VI secretion system protein TssA n=1 Tax=Sphingomonas pollutisoli TaxID=3030829 RepID=UPI0023B88D2A|nr:type VI secretion system protein TssA [Sphingomonas pollutisoli]MDF0487860.1 type VI secretion system protein TssA [Sphingomonas pollutisoli]
MTIDIEALLVPLEDEAGTGPDLAYDPQRHAIEAAFDAPVSIDASGMVEEAAAADWRPIVAAIQEQGTRTKDVWLAVYLARAGARAGRFDWMEAGLDYLAGLVERYWPNVHPQLEEYGFQGRKGACDTLVNFRAFVGPLQAAPLFAHPRHGSFSGNDLQRFHRGGDAEDGYGAFRAALADGGEAELRLVMPRLDAMEAAVRRTDAVLVAEAGNESGTNFAALYEALGAIRTAIHTFAPQAPVATDDGAVEGVAEASGGGEGTAGAAITGVRNRDEVRRALALITDYYRIHEPCSPVPLLLTRAQAWVDYSFLDVLGDIAPGAVPDVRMLLELRERS